MGGGDADGRAFEERGNLSEGCRVPRTQRGHGVGRHDPDMSFVWLV